MFYRILFSESPVGLSYRGGLSEWEADIYQDVAFQTATLVEARHTQKPETFELYQNFPNPFRTMTTVAYALPRDATVAVNIYDILGREVRSLVNGIRRAGFNSLGWDGRGDDGRRVSSGIYLVKARFGDRVVSRKLMVLR